MVAIGGIGGVSWGGGVGPGGGFGGGGGIFGGISSNPGGGFAPGFGSLGGFGPSFGGYGIDPGTGYPYGMTDVDFMSQGWGPPGYNPAGWPTVMGEVQRGVVPQYFTAPPRGIPALSPLAQAYLSRMFNPWTSTPTGVMEMGPEGFTPAQIVQGEIMKYAQAQPAIEGVAQPDIEGVTAKQTPKTPSAQLYSQLGGQGALPALQGYIENILGIPWQSFIEGLKAIWPAAGTAGEGRPVQWRVARQR